MSNQEIFLNQQVASLHPPHEEVQHPRRLETQVKVTMKYLGVHKEKWGAANQSGGSQAQLEEEPDEILLMQQHCGGNTYPIFRGFLYRNSELIKTFLKQLHVNHFNSRTAIAGTNMGLLLIFYNSKNFNRIGALSFF